MPMRVPQMYSFMENKKKKKHRNLQLPESDSCLSGQMQTWDSLVFMNYESLPFGESYSTVDCVQSWPFFSRFTLVDFQIGFNFHMSLLGTGVVLKIIYYWSDKES